jgi:aspartate kinase
VLVASVVYDKAQAKLTIAGVPDRPGIAADIFNAIAGNGINVDMIIQNISVNGLTDISLTVPDSDAEKTMERLEAVKKEINAREVLMDGNMGKVSVVGVGMRSHPGVAAKMFSMLADAGINLQMISTSEIKISCIIDEEDVDRAVTILHEGFELGKE